MKICTYCGQKNSDDDATQCAGCGTSTFVTADSSPMVPSAEQRALTQEEVLIRARPKFVIIAGIWLIYGSGIVGNILVMNAVLSGNIRGLFGFVCFWISLGCGALCVYLLYRVVKNYNIHKKRALDESLV